MKGDGGLFAEVVARWRTKGSQLLGVAYFLVFIFSEKKIEAISPLLTGGMFITGCAMVGLATVGRLWCAQYIAGYKDDVLVMDGPYSVCRNPLYFFSFIGGVGVGLCTESVTLAAVVIAVFAVIYPPTMRNEEKFLLKRFGDVYQRYADSVPRFFPRLSLFHEPAEYVVKPKVFRREVFDAMYFVWIVGVLEFFEILTELRIIPALFSIY